MAPKLRMRKGVNIGRVVAKIAIVVISLWVGGTIVSELGSVMNCTASPFYEGLSLIGWTITDAVTNTTCSNIPDGATWNNVITNPTGSGILAVIGIIGIASIVLEFVQFRF